MNLENSEKFFIQEILEKYHSINSISREEFSILKMTGDASTRRYYRAVGNNSRYVVCLSEPLKDKNTQNDFIVVHELLERCEIAVPKVYYKNEKKGIYVEEDLGDETFLKFLAADPSEEREFKQYKKAIDILIDIHSVTDLDKTKNYGKLKFDVEKLMFEVNMTNKYFLKEFLKVENYEDVKAKVNEFFNNICHELSSRQMVLTHRDYHSRNLMVVDDELKVIDFQDARLGIPQYDLVSILEDCYYKLTDNNKKELKSYYWNKFLKNHSSQTEEEYNFLYDLMTIQRVYKAIGSFCYIYSTRSDDRYIKYVGFAFEKIRKILSKHQDYLGLSAILSGCYYES